MKIKKYLIYFIVFLFGLIYLECGAFHPPTELKAPFVEYLGKDVLSGRNYTISWNYVSSDLDSYYFTVYESQDTSFIPFTSYDTELNSISLYHNVKEARTYYYRVKAITNDDYVYESSELSNMVSVNVVLILLEPEIEVLPTSLSFGYTHSQKTFTIRNSGSAVLNITSITAPDGFTVDKSTPFSVSENESQVVTVTFSPTDSKSYSGNITISSDDYNEPVVIVSVSGTGVPAPEIEVLPASLSFDMVTVSESSQKTFTIKNTGTAVLNITSITAPDGFTVDKSTSFSVSANDSQVVTVTFSPTAVKSYSDIITIDSDDPDEPQVTVSVSGTGAAPEIELLVLPASLSFDIVPVSESSQKTFTIRNTGTAVLNITSITAPDGFTVVPSTPFSVPANDSRIVTVTFSPTDAKSYSGNITIDSDDPDEPQVFVSVSGTGVPVPATDIEVVPASLSFDIVTVSESSQKTFTIKNTGNVVLNVSGITAPDGFTVDKSTPFTVSENDIQVVTVTFSPTDVKSYSGDITIDSDDPDEPQVFVSVSGTGEPAPEIEVLPASLSFGSVTVYASSQKTFTIKNTGTAVLNISGITVPDGFNVDISTPFTVSANESQVVTVTFSPTDVKSYSGNITINSDDSDEPQVFVSVSGTGVPAPEIEVVPASLSFGSVTVSASSQKTFLIKNTGTAVLNVTSITAPDGFTLYPSTDFTVPENSNRVVTVTFSPTDVKSYSGNITINSDDSDEPQVFVSVSGTGAPPPAPEIEVSPASLPFDSVKVLEYPQKTFTIKNTGNAVLNISGITTPEGFTVDKSTPFTVPANNSQVVTVTFSPFYVKNYSGNITINSDDSDEPQVFVSVSGTGIAP